jgi:hypothetical protein
MNELKRDRNKEKMCAHEEESEERVHNVIGNIH